MSSIYKPHITRLAATAGVKRRFLIYPSMEIAGPAYEAGRTSDIGI